MRKIGKIRPDWKVWILLIISMATYYGVVSAVFWGKLTLNLRKAELAQIHLTSAIRYKDIRTLEDRYITLYNNNIATLDNFRWVRKELTHDRDICISILKEKFNHAYKSNF